MYLRLKGAIYDELQRNHNGLQLTTVKMVVEGNIDFLDEF